MSEGGGSALGGLLDDLVDGFFGALHAPIDLAITTLHGKPSLTDLDEGASSSSGPGDSGPSPSPGH